MADSEPGSADVFDNERLQTIIKLMQEFDLSEVNLEHGDQKIQLKRGTTVAAPQFIQQAAAPPPPAAAGATAPAAPEAPAEEVDGPHIHVELSPMVGTFYSKPNPDSPAFVKIGDHVTPDSTICTVEAMKTFNEIHPSVSGKVVAMLVENEAVVDVGKPLFKIDTRG